MKNSCRCDVCRYVGEKNKSLKGDPPPTPPPPQYTTGTGSSSSDENILPQLLFWGFIIFSGIRLIKHIFFLME